MKKNTIYRTDAIEAVEMAIVNNESIHKALLALPSADVVSREDYHNLLMATNDIDRALREYQAKEENSSAEAESKWTCTANFIVKQLERLKDMTNEERIKLLQTIFPSVEVVSREEYEKQERVIKGLQAVIDNYKADYERFINAQSTEAVQRWIPCSERLPSENDDYLCTIPLDVDETYVEVLTFHKGRFYEDDDEWGATYHDDVLAWMPLPKPYREDGEE